MSDRIKITLLSSQFLTHDVKRFVFTKPSGFEFKPGQGVELAINDPIWKNESRPFTPSGLVDDKVLEFTIKSYPAHDGVTQQLHKLKPGAELLISDPFGTISYKGPGVFLAGGAGITPFIAIFRELESKKENEKNTLIYSNKTPADIIYEKELRYCLRDKCILTCTANKEPGFDNRRIDKNYLEEKINNFDQPFYVCGPPPFMESVNSALESLGADPQNLIFEQ